MTFSEWLNKTSMTSLKQFVAQIVWFIGSLALTWAAVDRLMVGPEDYIGKVPFGSDPKNIADTMSIYLAMCDSYIKSGQSTGLIIAGSLLTAWVGGKGFDAFQHKTDRKTSKEFIQAEADADRTRTETREHTAPTSGES